MIGGQADDNPIASDAIPRRGGGNRSVAYASGSSGHREDWTIAMRLTPSQIQLVKKAVTRHFGARARVWVFGSRTDDSRRGGDFDFYLETDLDDPDDVIDRKLELLAELHATPDFEGEKIDLVIQAALPCASAPIYRISSTGGCPTVKTMNEVRAALGECEHHAEISRRGTCRDQCNTVRSRIHSAHTRQHA